MKIENVHSFNLNGEDDFVQIQNKLKSKVDLGNIDESKVKICAGVDIAYWENDGNTFGACSIVVLEYKTTRVLEKVFSCGKIEVPYVAGFLAFRELPLIIEAAKKLSLEPDVILFDGNGYLHYNHMGIATHSSFFLNKPTIGIAKSYLKINQVAFEMPANEVGAYTDIVIHGEVYGRALRTQKNIKPIFVSCGNYIDLETSYRITMNLINKESKLPVPVRLADLESHALRERFKEQGVEGRVIDGE